VEVVGEAVFVGLKVGLKVVGEAVGLKVVGGAVGTPLPNWVSEQ
jgi:hypothetical protein